jgi:mevalonate kinase
MAETLHFEANGKLLITGEYLVLKGAEALAMPVRFGQKLVVTSSDENLLHWTSEDSYGTWFSSSFDTTNLNLTENKESPATAFLCKLLKEARILNPGFLGTHQGCHCKVTANYPVLWGLGSSSTLIALVAKWAVVDKFELFQRVSKGSGYDLACSDRTKPIYYRLQGNERIVEEATPGAALQQHAWFAYLGKKQNTEVEVSGFLSKEDDFSMQVDRISHLTRKICQSSDIIELYALLEEHEEIISRIIGKEKISKRFNDFPGNVKSLGAWGGDFGMFVSPLGEEETKHWLHKAGLTPVFNFRELQL